MNTKQLSKPAAPRNKATTSTTPNPTRPPFPRIDVKALKASVGDNWLYLLQDLAPDLEAAVKQHGHHVPCPMHGGKDGFKLFNNAPATGGAVCNSCGAFSDGISLLMAVNEWSFIETVKSMQAWLDDNDLNEEVDK